MSDKEPSLNTHDSASSRMWRGSQKHVLDWTDSPDFSIDMLRLVKPVDARLSADSVWLPRGHAHPQEARLETFGPRVLPGHPAWDELRSWWLRHLAGANTPNWDLAVRCEIEGRPGLILVEAKAHLPELSEGGKREDPKASSRSQENQEQIVKALGEACAALGEFSAAVAISHESHYQLANRLAFTWKLASLGIPTVLVYLGFLGDTGLADVGRPFLDAADWDDTFHRHASGVAPRDLFEKPLECGDAKAWFLVRSRGIHSTSPGRDFTNPPPPSPA